MLPLLPPTWFQSSTSTEKTVPATVKTSGIKAIAILASSAVVKVSAVARGPIVRIPSARGLVSQQTLPVRPVDLTTNGMPSFLAADQAGSASTEIDG